MPVTTDSVTAAVEGVRHGVGYAYLDAFGLAEISGPEAAAFLQAQTTNDILKLQPGEGHYGALLDRKAHIQAYFSCHRVKDRFWLLMEQSQIERALAHLETYHFSEDVTMQDRSNELACWTVQGPASWKLLSQGTPTTTLPPDPENSLITVESLFGAPAHVIRRSLTGEDGYIVCVPQDQSQGFGERLQEAANAMHAVLLTPEALNVLRIEAGIPRDGLELHPDVMLPETGLERVAVSYTKGCYQGQEIIGKIKTLGSAPKGLVGLVFQPDAGIPPENVPIHFNQQRIGTLTSSTYSPTLKTGIAMAYLGRDYRIPNRVLTLDLGGKTMTATVVFLPFYTAVNAGEKARQNYEQSLHAFSENREDEAITLLREAIDLDPHLADAYEALGVILSRREELDEAITLMQKLAEINPDEVMAHTNLSVFYMKKGMKEEAETEKALATTLTFKNAMKAQQQAKTEAETKREEQQALEGKVAMFQEVLALDAEDALANYGLGNTYNALERFTEAIPHLEKALAMDAKYTVAYLALGKALEGNGQLTEAKTIYEKGIEVAAKRGDLMPMQEMQRRLLAL